MALTDFQRNVYLRALEGENPEVTAESLGVDAEDVREAIKVAERFARENPAPPMPRNWPTGPYTDEELQSVADHIGMDVESVRATFPGAATWAEDSN